MAGKVPDLYEFPKRSFAQPKEFGGRFPIYKRVGYKVVAHLHDNLPIFTP